MNGAGAGESALYLSGNDCSNSILSKRAGPPKAVGAMPVRVNSPKSFHRSTVTTVHSVGTPLETSFAAQPLVLAPL